MQINYNIGIRSCVIIKAIDEKREILAELDVLRYEFTEIKIEDSLKRVVRKAEILGGIDTLIWVLEINNDSINKP